MTPRKRRAVAPQGGSAEVVSFAARAAARDNPQSEASAYVASARAVLGMTPAEFARYLTDYLTASTGSSWEVTASAVTFYEEGDAPPGEVLIICMKVTGVLASPGAEMPGRSQVYPYVGRGLITRDQWNGIIKGSARHLWLYGMAEQGYANDDAVPAILTEAADAGCSVRVLLLDPDSPVAMSIDGDEGHPAGTLPARIRASVARFTAMRDACPEIEVRTYDTYPTLSIVRGDGSMLVTPYLRYTLGSNSPTFELTDQSAPGLFACWERHFESIWNHSRGQD